MDIREHEIPFHLPLAKTYVENFTDVADLYDFSSKLEESYHTRAKHVLQEELRCPRPLLIEALQKYNRKVENHPQSFVQIDRLQDPEAVVVIGGQQPGLFTGPLYTIYKAITVLQLAKREEERLGVPVIPIFWIAGEDHDWDEVNHIFGLTSDFNLKKYSLKGHDRRKMSISDIELNQNELMELLHNFLRDQVQTGFTPSLSDEMEGFIKKSSNLSDLFARFMGRLFGEDGLVFIDSADPLFRNIEGEMFARIIEENSILSNLFLETREYVSAKGYTPQVETTPNHAHLFIYQDGERVPLERMNAGFKIRNGSCWWSKEELKELALTQPEQFSCNVVTRPLMQEYLFPVLAFVAGPGEISYWGLYRKIFHHFGYQLPIIVPRITISLVENFVQKVQHKYGFSLIDMLDHFEEKREAWLKSQDELQFSEEFIRVKAEIQHLYQPLLATISQVEKGLQRLGEENLQRILTQVDFLAAKTATAFEQRHMVTLRHFDRAKLSILPNDRPQERVLNLLGFVNKYGWDWWHEFKQLHFSINDFHKEIIL